jgi:hypothetical protein
MVMVMVMVVVNCRPRHSFIDMTDFDANMWTVVVENKVPRAVYKRDADDHSYSLRTPMAGQSGPFAGK